jgi:hypothetical protein
MRDQALGIAATTVMLATTAVAAALIWVTATDPLSVAELAANGSVWSLLVALGERMLALIW